MIKLLIQNPLIPSHTENTYTKVTCETCDHWDPKSENLPGRADKNGNLIPHGECNGMETENEEVVVDIWGPDWEFQGTFTHKDFGCALYENKKEAKS